MAKGFIKGDKAKSDMQWRELVDELNIFWKPPSAKNRSVHASSIQGEIDDLLFRGVIISSNIRNAYFVNSVVRHKSINCFSKGLELYLKVRRRIASTEYSLFVFPIKANNAI
ncbi:PREDICTED: uncharacterized protein LOC108382480 [Rhagoletis zephyria]|uniref:uncharacterized protein LOC108382480 n=1 Tax=Rhagoletis zephyria TaxID=28612 RepID=UPI0008113796|nr:PREDICTED: uncharacterized protein LOC108382480 [Rhagoletis zephyria]XP_017494347.1 PREDICTED: uncharacterized protein LOC108382480 [Rhagoletis zephyria]